MILAESHEPRWLGVAAEPPVGHVGNAGSRPTKETGEPLPDSPILTVTCNTYPADPLASMTARTSDQPGAKRSVPARPVAG